MSLFKSEYELKVSFEDLDPMNIVWYGNYMRYMEQARCNMFEKLNYTYRNMKNDGYAYPIAKMQVKYIKPANFEDILTVKLELISVEPTLDIKYKIYNKKSGEKIYEATTMQIAIDLNTRKSLYEAPVGLIKAINTRGYEKI